MNTKKVSKSLKRRLIDLSDQLQLLLNSIQNCRTEHAFFKEMAIRLRILVCRGSGDHEQLFSLAREFKYELIYINGLGEKSKLTNFIHNITNFTLGKHRTNHKFIKIFCNDGGGAHEQIEVNEILPFAEQFIINGLNPNQHLLLNIANTVYGCGEIFLEDKKDYINTL